MADFIIKATGARVSAAARRTMIDNGANPNGFAEEGSIDAAIAQGAPPPRVLRNDEEAIFVSNGSRVTAGARLNRIATGVNKPSDFAPVPGSASPPSPKPAVVAAIVAAAPAPTGPPPPDSYVLPSGLVLSAQAAASYVARGLCLQSDLAPAGSAPRPATTPSAPEVPPAPAAPPPSDIVAGTSALPLNPDRFTRAQLGAIAMALGLDDAGNKTALAAAINGLGDEVGTAAAIAVVSG